MFYRRSGDGRTRLREGHMAKLNGTGIRTFEIVQYVSGHLEGAIDDWPAQVQDAVWQALEDKAKEVGLPLSIVLSKCEHDPELTAEHPHKFWLHIIASEVVMADERTVDPRRLI